jgi:O-antigen/teichoic acid export membrane protein
MTKRLSQNTLILIFSNLGSAGLSFLLSILIGRFYGESGLGSYASVLAWIYPLSFIVEFGFGTLITRDIAQQPDLASHYLRLTWQFRIVMGSIVMVLICATSTLLSETPIGIIISSPLIIILPAYSAYNSIFRAHQSMRPVALLNVGMLLAQVIFTGLVISYNMDLTYLFIVNTLTSFGQLLVARWIYHQYFYEKPKIESTLQLWDLIRQSRPFAIAGIISAFQARFSIIWLESVSTPIIVGLFVASLRFIDGAKMIPNALFGAVYPALSSLSNNRQVLNQLFIRILLGLSLYSAVVVGILWVFASDILQITFGQDFTQGSSALFVMGLMLIPFLLRSGWSLYWYALGREKAVNRILIINLIVLITLPSAQWMVASSINYPLEIITVSMLTTELITVTLMLISEVMLWRKTTPSTA